MSRSSMLIAGAAMLGLLIATSVPAGAEPPYPPAIDHAVQAAIAANDPLALAALVGANPRYAAEIVAIGVTAHPEEAAAIAADAASAAPQAAPQIAAAATIANPKSAAAIAGAVSTAVPAAGPASANAIINVLPETDRAKATPAIKAAVKAGSPLSRDESAEKATIDSHR
jgi:hypothetical protein